MYKYDKGEEFFVEKGDFDAKINTCNIQYLK